MEEKKSLITHQVTYIKMMWTSKQSWKQRTMVQFSLSNHLKRMKLQEESKVWGAWESEHWWNLELVSIFSENLRHI